MYINSTANMLCPSYVPTYDVADNLKYLQYYYKILCEGRAAIRIT